MDWTDVKARIEAHQLNSSTSKSNTKSLLALARKAERVGLFPKLFMKPKIGNLYTIVFQLKEAALNDDIERMKKLLEAAGETNMTDLRLKMGKKVQEVKCTKVGDAVVAVFTA